ncbi:hypothetical protein [Rhizobium lusitanum]|uniref:Uncharacterized protein n=1 Tax=Rhizobium lusitanum TaxID=293958 RepID=A0A7X0IWQ8_9HYPH|nr:hypothetical protein [Rhizobium lusitanum]MBB6488606.1 hypothetical protein [Rhizobium lusitanum]
MTEFSIRFAAHLRPTELSNLKGILLSKGVDGSETDAAFILVVSRSGRVSRVAITLNSWVASGWIEEWTSTPPLVQTASAI